MTWQDGYVSEIGYTYGYYKEMSPLHINMALLRAGLKPLPDRPLRYLDLGCGQGVSLNIHAATGEGEYWGVDFLPGHIAFAQQLADASGANVTLLECSFAEFLQMDDVPQFDVIVAHGVWSWVSAENRQLVGDIVREKLAPGGVFYVSYNALPGYAPLLPLRHLLHLYMEASSSLLENYEQRIQRARTYISEFIELKPLSVTKNQQLVDHFNGYYKEAPAAYIAHEMLNQDWEAMSFQDMAKHMKAAKLNYGTFAALSDDFDAVNLTDEGNAYLNTFNSIESKEIFKDYLVNRLFRRDLWIKGDRHVSMLRNIQLIDETRYTLVMIPEGIKYEMSGALGTIGLRVEVYEPLVQALAADHYSPKSIHDLKNRPAFSNVDMMVLRSAVLTLIGLAYVSPVSSDEKIAAVSPSSINYNRYVLGESVYNDNLKFLASPVIAAGIPIVRPMRLMLLALLENTKPFEESLHDIWQILISSGVLYKSNEGEAIDNTPEGYQVLKKSAELFMVKQLPLLKALKII